MPKEDTKLAWLALIFSEKVEADQELAHYYVKDGKPEGKVVELVDVIIRAWDMIGACGWVCAEYPAHGFTIEGALAHVIEYSRTGHDVLAEDWLNHLIGAAFDAAESIGYNREMVVGLIIEKDAYNQTRSHRHGGKLA